MIQELMSREPKSHRRRGILLGTCAIALLAIGAMMLTTSPTSMAGATAKGVGAFVQWPAQAKSGGSKAFWRHWGDGKAELSSYKATIDRYGEKRAAELVLIYVTEPMDRSTWIKNDNAPKARRVPVLKLNMSLKFKTGLYPYSVLTSIFSPVSRWRSEPFSPAKITLTAQEWCGHVFAAVWAGNGRYRHQIMSYFASEGEGVEEVKAPKGVMYEDGLLIQLRELDGAFAGGKPWQGKIVPALWRTRKLHRSLRPLDATIKRSDTKRNNQAVTRFTLKYKTTGFTQTYDVEKAWPRRILAWTNAEGETLQLHKSQRLPYWNLNSNASGHYRKQLGLK